MKISSPVAILLLSFAVTPAAEGDHPYVETLERYRAARESGNIEALRQVLSEDSRIWFDRKEGPGRKRDVGGRGPWSDWDEFFRSETDVVEYHVEGSSLRTTAIEINDWYRLVDRPASRYYITYYFDADGRIEGTLIHSIPGTPERTDRLAEFKAWAAKHHPGLLEQLLPGDNIDPAIEKARLWKRTLLEWRAQAGLGNPLDEP